MSIPKALPPWLGYDALAVAIIKDGTAHEAAFEISERVAIMIADSECSETHAIMEASGGYFPMKYTIKPR